MNQVKTASFEAVSKGQAAKSVPKNLSDLPYNVALGYLKAFIIVLVVAHHAAIAFHLNAPPPTSSLVIHPRLWGAFPVVDGQHSMITTLFTSFNDTFFMSLMFFLSGLFVWKSYQRKGRFIFLRDRLIRLGLPFIMMVLLSPLAYYPAYLQTGSTTGLPGFWHQWQSLGDWPTGPAWFIWLLLGFDCLAVLLSALIPKWGEIFGRLSWGVLRRPIAFFGLLVIISAAAYIPMALHYDPNWSWWKWGPFQFQTSRIFLYMVYFLTGVALGTYGIERTLFVSDSMLARRWVIWVVVALAAFLIAIITYASKTSQIVIGFTYIFSCVASSFAFLAIFLRFTRKRRRIFDSLSANGYGIYIFHYVVVSWLLFALLESPLPAIAKGSIIFLCALSLCWAAIAIIRRIPAVARVI
jgi:peptidoglycan/LPS O-acetylase OafA/YrhL